MKETTERGALPVADRKQGERDCSDPVNGRQTQPFVSLTLALKPGEERAAISRVDPLWREKFAAWFGEEPTFPPITDGAAADSTNYHLDFGRATLTDPTYVVTFAGPCRPSTSPGTFTISSPVK